MIQPQRIGRFLPVDESGHVQPDVNADLISDTWKPLVEFVTRSLARRPGVRAVYIRGSIPRGLAIENVSDADFIYFSENNFDAADAELEKSIETDFPFVNGLELFRLGREQFDHIRHRQRRPYFHMLVKTQGLFLAGDDIAKDIEPFRIGPEMVSHVFSLLAEFRKLTSHLEQARAMGIDQLAHEWFSKRIVRAGFEVTMERSNRFTRDLYLCYEQFAQFYPVHYLMPRSFGGSNSTLKKPGAFITAS